MNVVLETRGNVFSSLLADEVIIETRRANFNNEDQQFSPSWLLDLFQDLNWIESVTLVPPWKNTTDGGERSR